MKTPFLPFQDRIPSFSDASFLDTPFPGILMAGETEGAGNDGNLPPNPPVGHRPWPDPAAVKRDGNTCNVYALVVGINSYHDPNMDLKGCLEDVGKVKRYLKQKYGSGSRENQPEPVSLATKSGDKVQVKSDGRLHLCLLLDEKATYHNIIDVFEQHLSQASAEDTVWFHFSGHGAEQYTAEEFHKPYEENGRMVSIVPSGKDQTLVLYAAKDSGNPLYLADKEIAALLDRVAKGKNPGSPAPHIVVSLDSCHSGSGTRAGNDNPDLRTRVYIPADMPATRAAAALQPGGIRTIDSYYGNYSADNLTIPVSEHVVFSGCESVQTAGDLPQGGVFTTSLIKVLERAETNNKKLDYASLFTEVRAMASSIRPEQNPQFGTIGGFDPFTCFLEGWSLGKPGTYEVFEKTKLDLAMGSTTDWFVRAGAIHGLPTGTDEQIKVKILDAADEIVAHALATSVSAQHSSLTITEGTLTPGQPYTAGILTLPAKPIYVALEGNATVLAALKAAWDTPIRTVNATGQVVKEEPALSAKNVLIAHAEGEPARIAIVADDQGGISIQDRVENRTYIGFSAGAGTLEEGVKFTKEKLDIIVRWLRLLALENPSSKILQHFEFELTAMDSSQNVTSHTGSEITIWNASEATLFENEKLAFQFKIKMNKNTQDLYFYLFDLDSDCSVTLLNDEELAMRSKEITVGESTFLRQGFMGWGPKPNQLSVTRWFKLFATTEEMDPHQLIQKGVGDSRTSADFTFNPFKITNDWCALTTRLTVTREPKPEPVSEEVTPS